MNWMKWAGILLSLVAVPAVFLGLLGEMGWYCLVTLGLGEGEVPIVSFWGRAVPLIVCCFVPMLLCGIALLYLGGAKAAREDADNALPASCAGVRFAALAVGAISFAWMLLLALAGLAPALCLAPLYALVPLSLGFKDRHAGLAVPCAVAVIALGLLGIGVLAVLAGGADLLLGLEKSAAGDNWWPQTEVEPVVPLVLVMCGLVLCPMLPLGVLEVLSLRASSGKLSTAVSRVGFAAAIIAIAIFAWCAIELAFGIPGPARFAGLHMMENGLLLEYPAYLSVPFAWAAFTCAIPYGFLGFYSQFALRTKSAATSACLSGEAQ